MLEEGLARIDVEVPVDRLAHDIEHTLGHLSTSVRIPGFRKGKVAAADRPCSASAARRCSTRRCASTSCAGTPTRSTRCRMHPVSRPEIDFDAAARRGRAVPLQRRP